MAGLPHTAGSQQPQQWETMRFTDSENEDASPEEETVSESGEDDGAALNYENAADEQQSAEASVNASGGGEASADGITGRYLFNAGVLGAARWPRRHI